MNAILVEFVNETGCMVLEPFTGMQSTDASYLVNGHIVTQQTYNDIRQHLARIIVSIAKEEVTQ